jgi:hypothetical protein
MKMGVVMAGSSSGLENNNVSHIEFNAGAGVENIFETGMSGSHERTKQSRVTIKPYMQEIRHCQHYMSIRYSGHKSSGDEICPSVGIDLGTGKTETGLTCESNTSYCSTVATSVLHKAHLVGITAVEHFLDGNVVIRTVKSWIDLLKRIPMIAENLLECVFINAFHGCSLRTTITKSAG